MKKHLIRFLKILTYITIVLISIGVIAALSIQTRFFKDWLRDKIVVAANQNLNGQLTIGQINGSFLTNLELNDIELTQKTDVILALPKLAIEYRLLPLIFNEIQIKTFHIDSVNLQLQQLQDSTWNIANLAKDGTPPEPQTEKQANKPFGFLVQLDDFRINDASIRISAQDSLIPSQINDINLDASVLYSQQRQRLHLKEFRFRSERPDFVLKELSFLTERSENSLLLKDFIIRTAKNKLHAQSKYDSDKIPEISGELKTEPLQAEEFSAFFPDLQLHANPELWLSLHSRDDSLQADLVISEADQQIRLQLSSDNFKSFLQKSEVHTPRYTLRLSASKLNLAHWLGDPAMDYLINGSLKLEGQGIKPEKADLKLTGKFTDCQFFQRPVSDIELNFNYRKGDLNGKMSARAGFGRLDLKSEVRHIPDSAIYNLQLDSKRFDVSAITGNDSLATDIRMHLSVSGEGSDPDKIAGVANVSFAPSSIAGIQIDTMQANLNYRGKQMMLDSLYLLSDLARIHLNGNVNLEGNSHLKLKSELGDLMTIKNFIKADTISASGEVLSEITGTIDSLQISGKLQIDSLLYNNFNVKHIKSDWTAIKDGSAFSGQAALHIRDFTPPNFMIEKIDLQANLRERALGLVLDIKSEDLALHTKSRFIRDTIPEITISDLKFDIKDQHWSSEERQARIVLDKNKYTLDNFRLTSGSSSGTQTISAQGVLSLTGKEDFSVNIERFDIGALGENLALPLNLAGILSLNLDLRGTAENPVLDGRFKVSEGSFNAFNYKQFTGEIDYGRKKFIWQLNLTPEEKDSLVIDGYLPVNFSLADTNRRGLLKNEPMEIQIKTDRFPINLLKVSGFNLQKSSGYIRNDLRVNGTPAEPAIKGTFRIEDSAVEMPQYGIDYKNIQLVLLADSAAITLDQLQVEGPEEGWIRANGRVEFDSSLFSGKLREFKFEMSSEDFYMSNHHHHQLQLSGNAFLGGTVANPEIDGDLIVNRSSIYLPAVTGEGSQPAEDETSLPLLVRERRRQIANVDTIISRKGTRPAQANEEQTEFYKNLRGTVKITIPRNTWIKNDDMRLELSGDIELVKNGPDFEIFGPVEIIRGQYDLLGRRFTIEDGKLVFQGGKKINPRVTLTANYTFRTQAREKRELILNVTGNAENPNIQFTLDEQEISEGNAIAYIMFGRSLDELTSGQREGVAEAGGGASAGELATGFAANLISAKITELVGKELNLDYIEVKSDDNWQSASFVVGKYITNDLFVSYQQEFGDTQDDTTPKEVVTMEYELTDFLFLQLLGNSKYNGFDVIFKFDRE